jgi:hypothetical protein
MELSFAIIGRRSDVQTTRYIYAYLLRQCEELTDRYGKGFGKTWRNNFRLGLSEAAWKIFEKEKERLHNDMREEASRSVDPDRQLMRINAAIDKREAAYDTASNWAEENLHLVSIRNTGGGAFDASARAAGRAAGEAGLRISKAKAGIGSGSK